MKHLLNWMISALALWIVARLVPGFYLTGPFSALIAALVIGFVNATLGAFLKIVTFPLTLLTLGIFWLVINAAMITSQNIPSVSRVRGKVTILRKAPSVAFTKPITRAAISAENGPVR